jgi:hypothetical protein
MLAQFGSVGEKDAPGAGLGHKAVDPILAELARVFAPLAGRGAVLAGRGAVGPGRSAGWIVGVDGADGMLARGAGRRGLRVGRLEA